MQYVVLDLEWNGGWAKKAHGYFNEIIELGAVKLNENLEEIGRLQIEVRPVITKKLSGLVADLTNISPEELEHGTTFEDMLRQLIVFMGEEPCAMLTWSNTDLSVLMENCRFFLHSEPVPGLRYYLDIQAFVQRTMSVPNGQQIGLSKAAEQLGISAENMSLHRALDDALLTAEIMRKTVDVQKLSETVLPVNVDFYRRLSFKTVILHDINDPRLNKDDFIFSCPDCGQNMRRKGKWRFYNRAFCGEFSCGICEKKYIARVQCRLRYEGLSVNRKLTEKVEKPEEIKEVATSVAE